jgi:hypothetical protein
LHRAYGRTPSTGEAAALVISPADEPSSTIRIEFVTPTHAEEELIPLANRQIILQQWSSLKNLPEMRE